MPLSSFKQCTRAVSYRKACPNAPDPVPTQAKPETSSLCSFFGLTGKLKGSARVEPVKWRSTAPLEVPNCPFNQAIFKRHAEPGTWYAISSRPITCRTHECAVPVTTRFLGFQPCRSTRTKPTTSPWQPCAGRAPSTTAARQRWGAIRPSEQSYKQRREGQPCRMKRARAASKGE